MSPSAKILKYATLGTVRSDALKGLTRPHEKSAWEDVPFPRDEDTKLIWPMCGCGLGCQFRNSQIRAVELSSNCPLGNNWISCSTLRWFSPVESIVKGSLWVSQRLASCIIRAGVSDALLDTCSRMSSMTVAHVDWMISELFAVGVEAEDETGMMWQSLVSSQVWEVVEASG